MFITCLSHATMGKFTGISPGNMGVKKTRNFFNFPFHHPHCVSVGIVPVVFLSSRADVERTRLLDFLQRAVCQNAL